MSHFHYDTESLVLGGVPVGENNRFLTLLTKEFGLVRAFARSVRVERSKLRYCLQDGSHARISLVRGRDLWRITGAVFLGELGNTVQTREARQLVARVFLLVRRLAQGEERNERLFEVVMALLVYLARESEIQKELSAAEQLTVLRILAALGYHSTPETFGSVLHDASLEPSALAHIRMKESQAVSEINMLLSATQL
ncbi:hypothetical protein A2761_02220 [Candidatus Kaiserbacteria bacterium RIFCSPHIGHO2_01_FULL_51_33]|uniref:DNA replication/recombination mediator RecO N-terminal domain-containing protein n=1 Tax=Candidatus Kaiserbacteria bacterium RIFCSPLOWO2_01_FULL_51_21 TaxID=1798508 RepID=A0A1F6ED51_9BACT|nr:MAG: hypothetical protein A2761_02220 [Candidatus Kaiserbacteria bacterium RIFCSPHIGHO2_01_FULL_51_33]OGG71605.1 MAG: hypothetical protein A3A35_00310 [Candidatus Kaiserbacteria bacterium RIFCSPLOWO2_01_FULL_51_21]